MTEFFDMGGYAAYIWPSFGVSAFVLVALTIQSYRRLTNLKAELVLLEAASPRRRRSSRAQENQA